MASQKHKPAAVEQASKDDNREELDERVVDIARVAKVVKGGRHFGFRTVVVVGDNRGKVGVGVGKSRAVPDAIRKGTERARRNLKSVNLYNTTIPHELVAEHGGSEVYLKPASPGTGVIAAGGVRAVLECAGVKDILTKSLGSPNVLNVVYATWRGLQKMKNVEQEARARGKEVADIQPFWSRKKHG
jgi:small subunit ribosomal protein S5